MVYVDNDPRNHVSIERCRIQRMFLSKMSFISAGTSASNTLLWRELRRQRELQEQKLKKRKERLMLERKGRRSGLENASEDEGFGRSTLSADITTATWGGSTQMSSTQNDSAVSEGSSSDSDEEVLYSSFIHQPSPYVCLTVHFREK